MKPDMCSVSPCPATNYGDGCSCRMCVSEHDRIATLYANAHEWERTALLSMYNNHQNRIGNLTNDGWAGNWDTTFMKGWNLKPTDSNEGHVCKRCNSLNPWAGAEHLSSDGTYTCYECK